MSLWQFSACVEGWNAANGDASGARLNDDEFDEAAALAGWDDD